MELRKEEIADLYSSFYDYHSGFRDVHGRVTRAFSSNPSILNPVLSRALLEQGFKPHYPHNKKFAALISHDIDFLKFNNSITYRLRSLIKSPFKQNKLEGNFKEILFNGFNSKWSVEKVVNFLSEHNAKSTFFFLSLNSHEKDYNYNLFEIKESLSLLEKNGFEIGLHGGHLAFNDADKIKSELTNLQSFCTSKVVGYRNHFLKFNMPYTWRYLLQNDFLYDATFGYPDCCGFRNGLCYPFLPFEKAEGKFIDILEIPLVVMDATLFYYLKLDAKESYKLITRLIDEVENCHGVFTILWHNNNFTGEMGKLFKSITEYLSRKDPWFATNAELASWWRQEGLAEKMVDTLGFQK